MFIVLIRRICLAVPFLRRFLGMPSELYLVRHAESARNVQLAGTLFVEVKAESIVPDHKIAITTKGEQQAHITGKKFFDRFGSVPEVVIHSGYIRTFRTALGMIRSFTNHTPSVLLLTDNSLRERESGYTYTMTESEVREHFPFLQPYWNTAKGLFSRPVGGESLIDVVENRLRWVIQKTWRRYAGKRVCFVTHGRTIQCFRYILDDMSWEQMEDFIANPENTPKNCGVTRYVYDPLLGKLVLNEYNVVIE